MKKVLLAKYIEESSHIPLVNNNLPVGSVVSTAESINRVGSYDVNLANFFHYVTEDKNIISKEFTKELLALLQAQDLPLNFIVLLVEASHLLDEDITFDPTREDLENLLSAYCDTYSSPYERFLEIVNNPSLLVNVSDLKRIPFTNGFNLYRSFDKKETYSEFTLNPEDMNLQDKKQMRQQSLQEMNKSIMRNGESNTDEVHEKSHNLTDEEKGFLLIKKEEGDYQSQQSEQVVVPIEEVSVHNDIMPKNWQVL